jgi:hypothetical protein
MVRKELAMHWLGVRIHEVPWEEENVQCYENNKHLAYKRQF